MILGCCCRCHEHPSDTDEWENITKVFDYTSAASPAGIAPYARSYRTVASGDGGCNTVFDCGTPGAPDWQPACYDQSFDFTTPPIYEPISGVLECAAGPGEAVSVVDQNCFRKTGNKVSYGDVCRRYGFKNVQAKAHWPGMFGFINSGSGCCPDAGGVKTKNQSKYTTIRERREALYSKVQDFTNSCAASADYHQTDYYHAILDQTATVDGYGNVTRSGSISVIKYQKINGVVTSGSESPTGSFSDADGGWFGISTGDSFLGGNGCGVMHFIYGPDDNADTASALQALNIEALPAPTTQSPCIGLGTGGGFTESQSGTTGGFEFSCSDSKLEANLNWTLDRTHARCCVGDPSDFDVHEVQVHQFNHTVELSGSSAYADVIADAAALLDEWPLNDDAAYPWRYDAKTWLAPLVWRDSADTPPTISWAQDGFGGFIDDINYSGDVRGAPMPAGYGGDGSVSANRYFNFRHINYVASTDGSYCNDCSDSLGSYSPAELPPTATEWTDFSEGSSMMGAGAHIIGKITDTYGPGGERFDGPVYVQKWAETLEAWPSIKFSRPCGRDRYLFDETSVACITSFIGVNLILNILPAVTFEVGDIVALNDGGVYQIASKTTDQIYTVGTMLYTTPIACDGASKLRFPSARAVCSTQSVICVQTADDEVTCTTPADHWLKGGGTDSDTITFNGITGLTTATATWLSDTTFTVPGGTMAAPIGGTGTISHGATAAQIAFDTTCTKHDFIYREWQSQFRNNVENPGTYPLSYSLAETQYRISTTSLHPTVLCISPNSRDTFPHGLTVGFGSIEADQCYGQQWSADFLQAIADPYWQADHNEPCAGIPFWTMATQPCATLAANEYAYHPLVEPRLTVPDGADAMPATVTLHVEAGMPGYLGHPGCTMEAYAAPTVHNVRAAWLICNDWKVIVGHKC